MVGVLAMAAAAAPPPVKDYEIEVRGKICQVSFYLLWGIVAWGCGSPACFWDGERSVVMIHSSNLVWDDCLGVPC